MALQITCTWGRILSLSLSSTSCQCNIDGLICAWNVSSLSEIRPSAKPDARLCQSKGNYCWFARHLLSWKKRLSWFDSTNGSCVGESESNSDQIVFSSTLESLDLLHMSLIFGISFDDHFPVTWVSLLYWLSVSLSCIRCGHSNALSWWRGSLKAKLSIYSGFPRVPENLGNNWLIFQSLKTRRKCPEKYSVVLENYFIILLLSFSWEWTTGSPVARKKCWHRTVLQTRDTLNVDFFAFGQSKCLKSGVCLWGALEERPPPLPFWLQ